jgi:hypothetical protein
VVASAIGPLAVVPMAVQAVPPAGQAIWEMEVTPVGVTVSA